MAKKKSSASPVQPASQLITQRIAELTDWRGSTLARIRALIQRADPAVVEEWKWGIPVWSHDGILCTGETYKSVVKLTFPKGASLPDPERLFNSSLEGNARRAIDIREGEELGEAAFHALLWEAIALNSQRAGAATKSVAKKAVPKKSAAKQAPARKAPAKKQAARKK